MAPQLEDSFCNDTSAPPVIASADVPLSVLCDAAALDEPLVLRDGVVLHQRAIRADDARRLQAFHGRLSRRSIVFRFFGVVPELSSALAERLSHVDYEDRMAVVATLGEGAEEAILAVVRYQRTAPDAAEIALAVEDDWQGHGVARSLLRALASYARRRGFTTFIAEVMHDNDRMLALLRHCDVPTTLRLREGHVEARLDISGLDTRMPTGHLHLACQSS